ncbi:MAG: tyrosine--tRNA ligase [Bacteroidetes bacterium]|nr:tyrosine--tRNA ligase [Bacteroidota bacterium]
MNTNFLKNLRWRNLIHDITPGTEEQLKKEMTLAYIGYDATASSLHIGNLGTIMLLKHFQLAGHKPIIIVGGATTMVGDPGGKKEERKLMDEKDINNNLTSIKKQLSKFLDFGNKPNSAEILNNYDWHKDFNFLKFLREVGKHIPVSYMLSKESVKRRLEIGLSFAEFSYQLLQGYDFYYLYKNKSIKMQMGGSDQWGNLTTGTELIRRKLGGEAFALTMPLVTKKDGNKFGKTEEGAIWLDPKMTSPYKFYQFWLNCADEDIDKFIKIFSLLDEKEINELIEQHNKEPHKRILQKSLAKEITTRIHSKEDCDQAINASEILFGKNIEETLSTLKETTLLEIFEGVPKIEVKKSILKHSSDLNEFLSLSTNKVIFTSKGEARRAIQNGGIYINKKKITGNENLEDFKLLFDKYLIIQKGKKNYFLVNFI